MQFSPSLGEKSEQENVMRTKTQKGKKRSNKITKAEQNEKFPNTVTGVVIPVYVAHH